MTRYIKREGMALEFSRNDNLPIDLIAVFWTTYEVELYLFHLKSSFGTLSLLHESKSSTAFGFKTYWKQNSIL